MLLGAIDRSSIKDPFCNYLIALIRLQASIIATAVSIMAGGFSMLNNTDQQATFFTIDEECLHLLYMARLLPFAPDGIARTTEKMRIAGFTRQTKRFLIHEGHHQHFIGGVVLNNHGNESLPIKCKHAPLLPR